MMKTQGLQWMLLLLATFGLAVACDRPEPEPEPTAPSVPTGILVHNATETSLTFQWSPVTGATSYDWKLLQGGSQVQAGSVSGRNVTVSGLTAGTDYQFAVRAVSAAGASAWSGNLTARTESIPEPPHSDSFHH